MLGQFAPGQGYVGQGPNNLFIAVVTEIAGIYESIVKKTTLVASVSSLATRFIAVIGGNP